MSIDHKRTLQAALRSRVESYPQGNALTFLDSRGRCEWRTFEEFYTASACWTSVLHDRGLRAGDGCVLVMPSDEDACQVLLACLILGALPVLIAPPVVRGMHSNLNAVVRHVVGKISAGRTHPRGCPVLRVVPGFVPTSAEPTWWAKRRRKRAESPDSALGRTPTSCGRTGWRVRGGTGRSGRDRR